MRSQLKIGSWHDTPAQDTKILLKISLEHRAVGVRPELSESLAVATCLNMYFNALLVSFAPATLLQVQ